MFSGSSRLKFALALAFGSFVLGWSYTGLANIVENPGFEADASLLAPSGPCGGTIPNGTAGCGTVTGWNVGGDAGEDTANPNSGSDDAFLGSGTLSQNLTTVAGATYSISFYLAADGNTLNSASLNFLGIGGNDASVDVGFGSDDLGSLDAVSDYLLSSASPDGYLEWLFVDTVTGTSTPLTLTGVNPDGTWYLDEFDVECTANCGAATAVPEPPSLLLISGALIVLLGLRLGLRPLKRQIDYADG